MNRFFTVLGCFFILTLTACGDSYRQIDYMTEQELNKVQEQEASYSRCVLEHSLDLDDGKINPKLIIAEGAKPCSSHISRLRAFLINRDFVPVQVNSRIQESKTKGQRKALESILTVRN